MNAFCLACNHTHSPDDCPLNWMKHTPEKRTIDLSEIAAEAASTLLDTFEIGESSGYGPSYAFATPSVQELAKVILPFIEKAASAE